MRKVDFEVKFAYSKLDELEKFVDSRSLISNRILAQYGSMENDKIDKAFVKNISTKIAKEMKKGFKILELERVSETDSIISELLQGVVFNSVQGDVYVGFNRNTFGNCSTVVIKCNRGTVRVHTGNILDTNYQLVNRFDPYPNDNVSISINGTDFMFCIELRDSVNGMKGKLGWFVNMYDTQRRLIISDMLDKYIKII